MASAERFGFQWNKYSDMEPKYKEQLEKWMLPMTPADFKNKEVLDAGCGMGRNSYWILEWGAKKLMAFDYDERSVRAASKNLEQFTNATVAYENIYDIKWQDAFDVVFSVGVIHHLKEPKRALENLVRALKSGGVIFVWVYSREGYEWLTKYIDPIRKNVTSKLPVSAVYYLAYIFSIPLWAFTKIFRGPTPYLKQLAGFKFWHVHCIVLDQLIPEVENYWTREEAENLLKDLNLKNLRIHRPPNDCGWTIIAEKS